MALSPSTSSSVNSDNSELVSSCCVADLLLAVLAEVSPDLEGIFEVGGGDGEGEDRGSEEAIDLGMLKAGGPVSAVLCLSLGDNLHRHVTWFTGSLNPPNQIAVMSPLSRLLSIFPLSLRTKSSYVYQNSRHMSSSVPPSQVATFAAGCFWGVEHIFLVQWPIKDDKGILKSAVGYTGGRADGSNPTYHEVCAGRTNHAEALRIEFDPSKVTYAELVGSSSYFVLW